MIDIEDLSRYYDSRMRHDLGRLCKLFKLPNKGDTDQFKGQHWDEMDQQAMKEYCLNDVDREYDLLVKLLPMIDNPEVELPLMQHTLNLYLKPTFNLDMDLAQEIADGMEETLRADLSKVEDLVLRYATKKKKTVDEILRARSIVPKILADILPEGESVPMKSNTKGDKTIPAMAANDVGFQLLLAHSDEQVRDFCRAKAACTSWPLHQAKIRGLMAQAKCSGGKLRVPLRFYGCHTGRPSGTQAINLLNLGGKGRGRAIHPLIGKVRHTLRAPEGHTLVICDSAQIEARELAWISGQTDLVEDFATGGDPYSSLASELFGESVWKPSKEEEETPEGQRISIMRGFGKDAILGCIAEGSQVFTSNGWKNIETVDETDKLWDGESWVDHKGVVYQGRKLCVDVEGVWMTPEHEVWRWGVWTTAAELSTNSQKSGTHTENLQSWLSGMDQQEELSPSNAVAPAVEHQLRRETVWSQESLHAVMSVLKRHPGKLRVIRHLYPRSTKNDFLIEFVQSLVAVKLNDMKDMVKEVSEYGPLGSRIESCFLNTWQYYQDGMTRALKSTGSTMIEDMSLVILGSPRDLSRCGTQRLITLKELAPKPSACGAEDPLPDENSPRDIVASTVQVTLPTYDILLAGPRKRFQVGGLIVANCGYGMGTLTFYDRCRQNGALRPKFDSGEYDFDLIDHLVKLYRAKYSMIPKFWRKIEKCFRWVTKYPHEVITYMIPDENVCLHKGMEKHRPVIKNAILTFWREGSDTIMQLPSGRRMFYRHAVVDRSNNLKDIHGKIYGGMLTENCIQAICRDLLVGWLFECEKNDIPILLYPYDELVGCVPEHRAEEALERMESIMCTTPDWAAGLPLGVDKNISRCYTK